MAHIRHRFLLARVRKAITWIPSVGIVGMRQTGKTTLLKQLGATYFTFDAPHTSRLLRNPALPYWSRLLSLSFWTKYKRPHLCFDTLLGRDIHLLVNTEVPVSVLRQIFIVRLKAFFSFDNWARAFMRKMSGSGMHFVHSSRFRRFSSSRRFVCWMSIKAVRVQRFPLLFRKMTKMIS